MIELPRDEVLNMRIKKSRSGGNRLIERLLLAKRVNPDITQENLYYLAIGIKEAQRG